MDKYNRKKSRCTKNKYQLTAREVAGMVPCSISYVKQLRTGLVNQESELAQRVLEIDRIAESGKSLLIQEIERIVKLP